MVMFCSSRQEAWIWFSYHRKRGMCVFVYVCVYAYVCVYVCVGGRGVFMVIVSWGKGWIYVLKKSFPLMKNISPGSFQRKVKRIKVKWSGGLQSMGSQRVGHDWATSLFTCSVRNLYLSGIVCSAPEECSLNQLVSHLLKLQVNVLVSLLTIYLEMSVMILDPKETSSIWKTKFLRRLS